MAKNVPLSQLGVAIDIKRQRMPLSTLAEQLGMSKQVLIRMRTYAPGRQFTQRILDAVAGYLKCDIDTIVTLSQLRNEFRIDQYPVVTLSGIAYRQPVPRVMYCEKCPYLNECYQIVTTKNGFALCETVLQDEIVHYTVRGQILENDQRLWR